MAVEIEIAVAGFIAGRGRAMDMARDKNAFMALSHRYGQVRSERGP
jgi:hypothetical protein